MQALILILIYSTGNLLRVWAYMHKILRNVLTFVCCTIQILELCLRLVEVENLSTEPTL